MINRYHSNEGGRFLMKRILSMLLAALLMFTLSAAAFADETNDENKSLLEKLGSGELFTVKEHTYQIDTKTVPLYQGFADEESTFDIEVAFLDGETNVPYVTLETMKEMLYRWVSMAKASDGGKNYDLEIEKNGDIVILTRENQYPVKINFAENTIEFYDYDAFIKISPDAPLMDVIASSGYDANGEPALFQKSDTSFERFGDPLTLKPGEYGIDLVYQDDEYYVPLQLISDFILTNYGGNVVYNTEAVCIVYIGRPDYLEDAFYPTDVPKERSEDLIAFNYKELCLALDALYGLKAQHNITDFNNLFQSTGLVVSLLSKDPQEAGQALADLCCKYFDDGHSGNVNASYMMKEAVKRNWGPSNMQRFDEMDRYKEARDAVYPDGAVPYEEVGNTAYITFDVFKFQFLDYYSENAEDHLDNTAALMLYAYQQITRENSPIENVVLDLSNNGGGDADAAAFVIGAFLGDASISMMNPASGALVCENYKVDLNLDRQFDEKDSLKDYNLFCIESPVSFSCGNLVPCALKNSDKVTLLGRPSSGGACVVFRQTTADGCVYQISGFKKLAYMKNGSFYDIDQGATPDYVIPNPAQLYDREYMTDYINNLLGK